MSDNKFLTDTSLSRNLWYIFSRIKIDKDQDLLFGKEAFFLGRYAGMTTVVSYLMLSGFVISIIFLVLSFFFENQIMINIILSAGYFFSAPLITTSFYLSLRWFSTGVLYKKHEKDEKYLGEVLRPTKWQNFYNFDYVIGLTVGIIMAILFIIFNLLGS